MVHEAVRAAERLQQESGWEIEVVDLRSVKPLDIDTVLASVARTGRLLALGEAFPWGGVTAEVVSRVVADGFHLLEAPPMRLNARDTPVPYHPKLWAAHRPTPESICDALRKLLSY
jgi:pyruvate dehydrogenase E1 component beta subunit/2-oxoisovalerate dehydrogenase E1 component beta subunit